MSIELENMKTTRPRKIVCRVTLQGWVEDGEFRLPSSRDFVGQVATLVSSRDMDRGEELAGYGLDFEPRENVSNRILHDGWLGASFGNSRTALGRWTVKAIEARSYDGAGEIVYRVELTEFRTA